MHGHSCPHFFPLTIKKTSKLLIIDYIDYAVPVQSFTKKMAGRSIEFIK
jgi:hypothetical protein